MIRRSAISVLVLLVVAGPRVSAQVLYGSLSGTVQDSTGAVVPGAAVTVTNAGTGQSLNASTSDSGHYIFPGLIPGVYELKISATGFRPFTRVNIAVTANTVRREDVTLELGQVTESVTVQAAAVSLQTEKADLHTELDSREVTNLPLPPLPELPESHQYTAQSKKPSSTWKGCASMRSAPNARFQRPGVRQW
jgi:Carboxypeptidase regulatory-like domain